jgi:hypothetical protein
MVLRRKPKVPRPDRVRRIEGPFGWLDHRLLRQGVLQGLTLEDLGVYVFLVLAADRNGTSWYRKEKICDALGLSWDQFEEARRRLLERGLIAFEPYRPGDVNGVHQVLPLPR